MTFRAVVSKEVSDLLREKRFGGWALAFLGFWTFMLMTYLTLSDEAFFNRRDYPQSFFDLTEGAYYIFSIAFVVLGLFVLSDGITKERESGMLPVVAATPAVRWHIPLAKVLAGFAAYGAAFLVSVLPVGLLAYSLGTPMLVLLAQLFLLPFLALYVFLLGFGLLLGTVFQSSKVAIGTGAGIYLLLFLMAGDSPFQALYSSYPIVERIVAFTPFQAAFTASQVVTFGGNMPWGPLVTTVALGAGLAGLAFYLFHRQEVAA